MSLDFVKYLLIILFQTHRSIFRKLKPDGALPSGFVLIAPSWVHAESARVNFLRVLHFQVIERHRNRCITLLIALSHQG